MNIDAYLRISRAAVARQDYPTALQNANEALNLEPERPEALYLAGYVLRELGSLGLALLPLSKALSTQDGSRQPNLWMSYAACLHDLHRWKESIQAFDVVRKMLPYDPMPPANMSACYVNIGKWADTINLADEALDKDDTNYIAKVCKAMALLSLGRWKDGWAYHDALYGNHIEERVYRAKGEEEPHWDGTKGLTVVVQADQGLGDQIMFAQCLPQMIADCKEVIVETQPRLVSFFKRNFGVKVYGTLKEPSQTWSNDYKIDARVPLSALGKFYRTLDKDFPRKPYITPVQGMVDGWKEWLSQFPRPWVGISWKGGVHATQKHLRSMELDDFAPVLNGPGTFIDLSYMDNDLEVSRWNIDHPNGIKTPPINGNDYEHTIALLAALDEVVTVTTTIVHACGALGRTCQVLVPEVAMWRYNYRIDDGMIWYPPGSVTLHRRIAGEKSWEPAVKRLMESPATLKSGWLCKEAA